MLIDFTTLITFYCIGLNLFHSEKNDVAGSNQKSSSNTDDNVKDSTNKQF